MRIGPYRLEIVETGRFALDGGAMFGVVPKTLWCKEHPPDERNRIDMALRALLIVGDVGGRDRRILIDTGIGTNFSEKHADIYRINHSRDTLERSLAALGIVPTDITDVILTHLHFDHCGGSTWRENGRLIPAFPNARYYIQKKQWKWANRPTEKDRASFVDANFAPLKTAGVLELTDGEFEFLPGIQVLVTKGHTPGHQLVKVSDGRRTVLYAGDTVPMASHVAIPWNMSYDNEPLVTMKEKRALLDRAVEEEWVILFEHDPTLVGATVKREDGRYKVARPLVTLDPNSSDERPGTTISPLAQSSP